MKREDLAKRTRQFAVSVFKMIDQLPQTNASRVVSGQLLRCSSSVAANYRAALRAKSRADFLHKLKIVLEEADESEFWLSFIVDIDLKKPTDIEIQKLINESNQLTAIFAKSVKTITESKS